MLFNCTQMALYFWNNNDYFRKLPSNKLITSLGKRRWDAGIEYKSSETLARENHKTIFTMPSFTRHGRWGNIVFQYLFIRILARNNNGEIELYKTGDSVINRMNLYEDMLDIPAIETKSNTILLDSYHIFHTLTNYIPGFLWRALYVSNLRHQSCFILRNLDEAINKPLSLSDKASIEVEGLFMFNPIFYKQQHKEYILSKLFQPTIEFNSIIQHCIQNLGQDKTIIGIHIRRGDYIYTPLRQFFQIPIPTKYIIEWLVSNISSVINPVIYVCSDDGDVYKEIEMAGFQVFCTKDLLAEGTEFKYEQLDWEILRKCNILLTSNSSFSFTSAFLSTNNSKCYRFSLLKKKFVSFDPWEAEPLQSFTYAPYVWSYLYSRFTLVWNMTSLRLACSGLAKDIKSWILWKITKLMCLYYIYGISLKFFLELFNLPELFRISNEETNYSDHLRFNQI